MPDQGKGGITSALAIDNCEVSVRLANSLHAAGVVTLDDVVLRPREWWLLTRGIGRKSMNQLDDLLSLHNIPWPIKRELSAAEIIADKIMAGETVLQDQWPLIRFPPHKKAARNWEIYRKKERGATLEALAQRFSVSRQRVRQIIIRCREILVRRDKILKEANEIVAKRRAPD